MKRDSIIVALYHKKVIVFQKKNFAGKRIRYKHLLSTVIKIREAVFGFFGRAWTGS